MKAIAGGVEQIPVQGIVGDGVGRDLSFGQGDREERYKRAEDNVFFHRFIYFSKWI